MNIIYQADIGETKMVETFSPTGEKVYYRTLIFRCANCQSEHVAEFIHFLDAKIELSKVAVSSEAIVLVGHNADAEPNRQAIDHLMTLLGSRILTCESLRWGFVPIVNCDGYRFTIYLPTTTQPVTSTQLFDAMKLNGKPSVERTEIKQSNLYGKLLVWLGVSKRRYNIVINGSQYEV